MCVLYVVSTQCVLYVSGEHTVGVFCMSVVSTQYVCSVRQW